MKPLTPLGIIAGIVAGGVVTALVAYLFPKSRLARIGSPILGVAIAYLVMRLV
ncbi:MAG: hypothetical protein JWN15_1841 [Firmicutes bacterium]|nr:hypothetical protein [Bacillota bacterium]